MENIISQLLEAVARWRRSSQLWLISLLALVSAVSARQVPRMAREWLQARVEEFRALWVALMPGALLPVQREFEWPFGGQLHHLPQAPSAPRLPDGLTTRRLAAPSDFTASVMARIRPLPAPGATAGTFLLARRVSTMRRSALPPLGIFLAVTFILVLVLGGTVVLAALNPDTAMLLLGILVSLGVVVLASVHSALLMASDIVANAWLSVPVLVGLLAVALVAGPQVLRYIGPLISES